MKTVVFSILIIILGVSSGCAGKTEISNADVLTAKNNIKWKETMGVILDSANTPDGKFAYTISYNVKGGNVKNMEGELIQGDLAQHIFGVKMLAVKGQKVKLRYNVDDPMFYELIQPIKFTK